MRVCFYQQKIRGEWRVEDGSHIRFKSVTGVNEEVGYGRGGEGAYPPSSHAFDMLYNALWVQWNPPNAERDCHATSNNYVFGGCKSLILKGEGRAILFIVMSCFHIIQCGLNHMDIRDATGYRVSYRIGDTCCDNGGGGMEG